ncbi:MAG: PKD domain-containing protein [Bacteroidetes bacterium]|nr:PKD domain-containing protein [Bacteroidota bacterium]
MCINNTVNFKNTGSSGSGVTHSWTIKEIYGVTGTTVDWSYTFLSAGTYSITHTVTNAGCTATVTSTVTVINCSAPTVTAAGTPICPGECATVTSIGTGGTTPYTYSWSNGSSTQNINPCPATTTTYTVTIQDKNGTSSTSTAVVTVNPAVTASTTVTNITCSGSSNGTATGNPGNGTPGYAYSWSNGSIASQISNLTSQIYTVTITDSKGCSAISTASIVSPPPLKALFSKGTASCISCGCKEWTMVNASGGTSPYSYSWPDGYDRRYKNHLCPGAYTINIKDKNGCSVNVNLTAP